MTDRLQREIDEILARLDSITPRRSLWWRLRRRLSGMVTGLGRGLQGLRLPRISLGQVLLLGIALIVVAYLLNPGGASVTRMVIVAGIVIFLGAFILSLRRQSRPPEKRWRGQPMELDDPGVGGRFRSWWERRRGRR